ncbi:signal recognition particle receptor subunit alpha, partial [Staphylococcus pseudintermedius]
MFGNLTESISNVFSKIQGKKVLTDKDITDSLLTIKEALLSADVSLEAADKFLEEATNRAIG